MTKMPDNTKAFFALAELEDSSFRREDKQLSSDEVRERVKIITDALNLTPQPVTDEARAKALDACETLQAIAHLNLHGSVETSQFTCIDTIKAALSQPVPIDEQVRQFLLGVGKLEGCEFGEKPETERGNFWWRKYLKSPPANSQLNENAPQINQPEAIQKAVEIMMPCVGCGKEADRSTPDDADMCHECFGDFNAAAYDELKAENAELRRAVVDLDAEATKGEEEFFGKGDFLPKTTAQQKHAATISKAKESQNV